MMSLGLRDLPLLAARGGRDKRETKSWRMDVAMRVGANSRVPALLCLYSFAFKDFRLTGALISSMFKAGGGGCEGSPLGKASNIVDFKMRRADKSVRFLNGVH